jgi:hypothetical protein
MPAACADASPRPAARKIFSTSRQGRGSAFIQKPTVFPSTNSIAMKTLS